MARRHTRANKIVRSNRLERSARPSNTMAVVRTMYICDPGICSSIKRRKGSKNL